MDTVKEVMTEGALTCALDTSLEEAAREMRDGNVGSLICTEHGSIKGIVTDRDIVVRAVAEGASPREATVGDCCSGAVTTIAPGASVDEAIKLAHDHHVRRLPVVDDGEPVGVFSLRDLDRED